jgi:membrane protease YdiL (CAAX protease family)
MLQNEHTQPDRLKYGWGQRVCGFQTKVPASQWTLIDVTLIVVFILLGAGLISFSLLFIFGSGVVAFTVFRYIFSIWLIAIPLLWLKKRYGIRKCDLGIREGHLRIWTSFVIFVISLATYFISSRFLLGHPHPEHVIRLANDYIYIVLMPISLSTFPDIVLAPIGEEIVCRGLIYGYLRSSMPYMGALIFQAVIFSFLHFMFMYPHSIYHSISYFVAGLVLGISYEATGSLYLPMVCHGAMNWIGIVLLSNWK